MTSAINHVAIIMDGNGRWAQRHGVSRAEGHRAGAETAGRITRAALRRHVPFLTLYALSTENLQRPAEELQALTRLLHSYLDREVGRLVESRIRLRVIGDRGQLAPDLVRKIATAEHATESGRDMTLCLALAYGGRDEIIRAARRLDPRRLASLTEPQLAAGLDTASIPDPDLLIRTGGDQRISNFLLWQLAYTELYFSRVLWPDFSPRHLQAALTSFARRHRRFGRRSE